MKVLMFGWEYPPHVFGGLATANFGISEGLHAQGNMEITLCLPHPFGDEDQSAARILTGGYTEGGQGCARGCGIRGTQKYVCV